MTTENRSKTISMCLNIEGFMQSNKYPAGYDLFQTVDGTPMSPADALTFLTMEKAAGRKVIPFSAECGNPCKHAANGCTGFDYGGGGCPGRYTDHQSEANGNSCSQAAETTRAAQAPAAAAVLEVPSEEGTNAVADSLFHHQEIAGRVPAMDRDDFREIIGAAITHWYISYFPLKDTEDAKRYRLIRSLSQMEPEEQERISEAMYSVGDPQHEGKPTLEQFDASVDAGIAALSPSVAEQILGRSPMLSALGTAPALLSEQDAVMLEQAADMLEEVEADQRKRGNDPTAMAAGCSAHAVRRLAVACLTAQRTPAFHPGSRLADADPAAEFNGEVLFRLGTYLSQFPEFTPEGGNTAEQSYLNIINCIERLRGQGASAPSSQPPAVSPSPGATMFVGRIFVDQLTGQRTAVLSRAADAVQDMARIYATVGSGASEPGAAGASETVP